VDTQPDKRDALKAAVKSIAIVFFIILFPPVFELYLDDKKCRWIRDFMTGLPFGQSRNKKSPNHSLCYD
jgi:hypothetical protein